MLLLNSSTMLSSEDALLIYVYLRGPMLISCMCLTYIGLRDALFISGGSLSLSRSRSRYGATASLIPRFDRITPQSFC